ncbi:MAG: hypothetical protein K8I82_32465 [Anaerolineae bacterium]|nr:hypothetical protein [Anaerolineae bacterium]
MEALNSTIQMGVITGAVAILAACIMILIPMLRQRDLFSFFTLYVLLHLYEFVIVPLFSHENAFRGPYVFFGITGDPEAYVKAMIAGLIHIVLLASGYYLSQFLLLRNSRFTEVSQPAPEKELGARRLVFLSLITVAITLWIVNELFARFGTLDAYFNFYMKDRLRLTAKQGAYPEGILAFFTPLLVSIVYATVLFGIALLARLQQTNHTDKLLCNLALFLNGSCLVILMTLNGYRQLAVYVIIGIFAMLYGFKRLRLSSIWGQAAVGIVVFSVVLAVTILQAQTIKRAWGVEGRYQFQISSVLISPHFSYDAVTGLMRYFPEQHDYINGETIFDVLRAPVPRSLWEEKKRNYGVDWVNNLMGLPASTTTTITLIGEYYINFSWIGIILLSLFQGFGIRVLDYTRRTRLGYMLHAFMLLRGLSASYSMGTISVAWTLFQYTGAVLLALVIVTLVQRRALQPVSTSYNVPLYTP